MDGALRLGVILSTVREGRRGDAFARWIHGLVSERQDATGELLDLKEWALPHYALHDPPVVAEKSYAPGTLSRRWADTVASLDGFVVVTPEYNHGYPSALKAALDHVYAPWNHKPIAFVSYGGGASGARSVEQLRLVAIELRMAPVRDEVNVRLVGYAADERGFPKDPWYAKKAAAMLDDLVWWARVLKEGREKRPR